MLHYSCQSPDPEGWEDHKALPRTPTGCLKQENEWHLSPWAAAEPGEERAHPKSAPEETPRAQDPAHTQPQAFSTSFLHLPKFNKQQTRHFLTL